MILRAAAAIEIAAAALVLPAAPAHADRIRNDQWHLRALNVAEAHRVSRGEGVTVAVIDTGVDPHPDLRDNLLRGADVVPGGTGDGRTDTDGHGSAMAGLLAAHGKGADEGALGIAPQAKIWPVRTATQTRTGTNADLARALTRAVRAGVDVISISSGGSPDPQLSAAVEAAIASDIVVIAAAGNRPTDVVVTFPAYLEGVLAVGATDRSGNRAAISVTGDKLAIMAPGVDIYSTSFDGKYYRGTGTSASTAIVAGAAALVRSRFPDLSAAEVVHRLTATATDKGAPGRDPEYGYGVLNLVAALTADVPPLRPSAPAGPSGGTPSTAATARPDQDGGRAGTLTLAGLGLLAVVAAIAAVAVVRSRRPPTPEQAPARARDAPGQDGDERP
jgi:type VII secretion-associated serine protease mycosin